MKCYAIEDHHTNQCNKPKEYKICSEYGGQGHTWFTCLNEIKKKNALIAPENTGNEMPREEKDS